MRQLRIHTGHVRAVAYSPDGRWIVSAGNDQTVRLIDAVDGKVVRKWRDYGRVMSSATFSPSGTEIAAGGNRLEIELVQPEEAFNYTLSFPSPGGYTRPSYPFNISALGYSTDGSRFFAGVGDRQISTYPGEVHLWTCPTGRAWEWNRMEIVPGSVWCGAFSPDGKALALGTGLGWRFCTLSPWRMGGVHSRGPGIKALAWSPNGRTLAVASGHSILLIDPATNATRAKLTGHAAPILALAFTPDSQRLLSGGWDQNVRVWDPHAASPVATYDWERGKVQHIAVAPDGMTAAAACDKGIVLWDLDD